MEEKFWHELVTNKQEMLHLCLLDTCSDFGQNFEVDATCVGQGILWIAETQ